MLEFEKHVSVAAYAHAKLPDFVDPTTCNTSHEDRGTDADEEFDWSGSYIDHANMKTRRPRKSGLF